MPESVVNSVLPPTPTPVETPGQGIVPPLGDDASFGVGGNGLLCPIFADRCASDPQGVIRDLLAQTIRQGKAIQELNQEIARLRARTGPSLLVSNTEVEENHDCPF